MMKMVSRQIYMKPSSNSSHEDQSREKQLLAIHMWVLSVSPQKLLP